MPGSSSAPTIRQSKSDSQLGHDRLGAVVARPPPRARELDPAENHRQLRHRDTQVGRVPGREGERAPYQPAHIQPVTVALPGQDLETVPAAVAENKQIAAARVPAQVGGHDSRETVEALAPVLRLEAKPNPPGQPEGQHAPPPRAATSRATAVGSVPTGTRTISPLGRTTSAVGSGTTRTGANAGAGGVVDRARAARRLRQE